MGRDENDGVDLRVGEDLFVGGGSLQAEVLCRFIGKSLVEIDDCCDFYGFAFLMGRAQMGLTPPSETDYGHSEH